MIGRIFQIAWIASAVFFLLSVAAAPLVALVIRCKARGRRLFRDEPLARVLQLHPTADHRQDAL